MAYTLQLGVPLAIGSEHVLPELENKGDQEIPRRPRVAGIKLQLLGRRTGRGVPPRNAVVTITCRRKDPRNIKPGAALGEVSANSLCKVVVALGLTVKFQLIEPTINTFEFSVAREQRRFVVGWPIPARTDKAGGACTNPFNGFLSKTGFFDKNSGRQIFGHSFSSVVCQTGAAAGVTSNFARLSIAAVDSSIKFVLRMVCTP